MILLHGQLLHIIRIICHYYVLTDPHSKSDQADYREHVLVVIKEAGGIREAN